MKKMKIILSLFALAFISNVYSQEEEFLTGKAPESDFVFSLHLYDKGLKELPDNFASWAELEVLFLDDNELKTLPPSIKKLAKLREISIPRNQFTSFPKEILELKSLKTLDIADNPIQNIPDEIRKLSQLEYLLLSKTEIKNIPESLCQLQNLEMLALNGNELTNLPACLKNMPKLEHLYVDENPFESFPSVILEMKNLVSLDYAQKNQMDLPAEIKNLKNLETLYINEDYYKKNKSKVDKLIPKNCKVNPPPPPPPTIEPMDEVKIEQINPVTANEYCFNFTDKIKKGEMVAESHYILEFGDFSDRVRLTKESSEYNEKDRLEAEKQGDMLVSAIQIEWFDGVYEKKDGNLILNLEKAEKKTFKIKFEKDGKKIKELTDAKKQVWKHGNCYAAPPMGM